MHLEDAWSAVFSEAWAAYQDGTIPVGAAFVDATGQVRYRGRNQVFSPKSGSMPLQHTRLAHAEINVLAQASPADRLYEGILYTTLEPCAMCVGAAVVCGARHIRYAAKDGPTGATELLTVHPFLASKNVKLEGTQGVLSAASLVLMTDWILREDSKTAGRTLDAYPAQDARALDPVQEWFRAGRLQAMAQAGVSSDALLAAKESAPR